MARYHVGFTTAAAAIGAAFVDLRTLSPRAQIMEMGLFATAPTAMTVTLERETAVGTASSTVAAQPGDPADTAAVTVAGTAWSTAPTFSALVLRSIQVPAQIGAGFIWTFPRGDLAVPANSGLALVNRGAAAGPICRGYFFITE